jgi:acyl-CoA synthetase (AMP-forming)/AMP-acid ligase II
MEARQRPRVAAASPRGRSGWPVRREAYPSDLENALLERLAAAESAVFGIPSAEWGEEVAAVGLLDSEGAAKPSELFQCYRARIGG